MKKKSSSKGSMIKFKTHTGAKYEFVSWKYVSEKSSVPINQISNALSSVNDTLENFISIIDEIENKS